jgi:molecular chaperone DnaK
VKLVPYKGGDYTIPSIFAIDDKGNELVGYEAKRQWLLNPTKTVYGAKRLVGRPYKSEVVEKMHRYFGYAIEPAADGATVEIPLGARRVTLEEVQGKILAKIKAVAEAHLGETITRAVVTVPAYFSDRQRQATKEAGALAGLDVVRILNEPTAAALAYGMGRGPSSAEGKTIAVYDLGGGTFDVSVIEVREDVFEVKATGGDIFLGGIDFDNVIIEHVLAQFEQKNGQSLRGDPIAMQRVKDMSEKAKIDLSSRNDFNFSIPFITMTSDGRPLDITLSITRAEFEAMAQSLVDRTIATCKRVLEDASLSPHHIEEVLLVGGQTRMPAIGQAIEQFFGRAPSKGVHPDEAVGVGAAIFAHALETDAPNRIQLLDVIPMAIGILRGDGGIHRLFPRNASVPNARGFEFTTSLDNQATLEMHIFQGDDDTAQENELLGHFTFSGLRPGPAGSVRVEVIFDLSQDGIVSLSARDLDTGAQMSQTVRINVVHG